MKRRRILFYDIEGIGMCLFGLKFYVPVNSYGHVNLTTPFPSKLDLRSAHTFACTCYQPFLNKRKEENDRRNYFMIGMFVYCLFIISRI